MALPQTACLALPGPLGPVPGTPKGRAWFREEDEAECSEVQEGRIGIRRSSPMYCHNVLPALPMQNTQAA